MLRIVLNTESGAESFCFYHFRQVLKIYRSLVTLSDTFGALADEAGKAHPAFLLSNEQSLTVFNLHVFFLLTGILLAEYCEFKPKVGMTCVGGLTGFAEDDGSRRLIEMHEEMEDVFPLYDATGLPMSPAERRFLPSAKCQVTFDIEVDGCGNKRSCTIDACGGKVPYAKCRGRQGKCLGNRAGISFPFLSGTSPSLLNVHCFSTSFSSQPLVLRRCSQIQQVFLAY